MLFNSYGFLFVFLPIVLLGFYTAIALQRAQLAKIFLLMSSIFFYAWWDYRFLVLLLGSIAFNYYCGSAIAASKDQKRRKSLLLFSISANLSVLLFYKYLIFLLSIFSQTTGISLPSYQLALPLGISFFTFTQIAFLVDAYYQKIEELTPLSYGLFVTVFPHLIAGPILHHREMISQFNLASLFTFNHNNITQGIFLFALGMSKKVIIADNVAPFANLIFDVTHTHLSTIDAWGGALAYTLQLYFDFSGYSDMAIGLGLMFNIQLPTNFDSPYKAKSVMEFWKRWHISLSQFLRDYIYIPLGGNKKGELAKYRNLFFTMLIGGIWHGAGWTYIVWGALHGIFLLINHAWKKLCKPLPVLLSWMLTFLAVVIGWVFFRAASFESAIHILKAMLGFDAFYSLTHLNRSTYGGETLLNVGDLSVILCMLAIALFFPNSGYWKEKFCCSKRWAVLSASLMMANVFFLGKMTEFLYYQF